MMTTKKIQLNTWGRNYVAVSAGQGEVNSRFLQITLVDETGDMTLTDKEVVLYAVKPDDNVIYNSCIIEDASQMIVSLELTSQMSNTPGVMACELHVTGASQEVLKIVGLEIIILECSDTSLSVESTSEFTRLSEALGDVETLKDNYQAIIDSPLTYSYLGVCPVSYGGTGNVSLTSGNILIGNGTGAVMTVATLPVANGGTGAATASGARTNLGVVIELGTWTPTLATSGTTQPTVTYSTQHGDYYVIGNLVYISGKIVFQCTNVGTTNTPRMSGLPYASLYTGSGQNGFAMSRGMNYYACTASTITSKVNGNQTWITLYDESGYANAQLAVYDGTHQQWLSFSGCYIKA